MQKTIDDILFSLHNNQYPTDEFFVDIEIKDKRQYCFAVSGGVDSMAMATLVIYTLLHHWVQKEYITILHYNHKQRKESDIEQQCIIKFFSWYNVYIWIFEGKLWVTENELRKVRWKFFESYMMRYPWAYLVLGHHLQDRIETMMLNMQRGCWLRGLLSLTKSHHIYKYDGRNYFLYRPFLSWKKQDIYTFALLFEIPYREDSSNLDPTTSQRNTLRREVSPYIHDELFLIDSYAIAQEDSKDGIIQYIQQCISFSSLTYKAVIPKQYLHTPWTVFELLDFCDIYTNCSQGRLDEVVKILLRQEGGHIYLWWWTLWKKWAYIYLFQGPRNFRKALDFNAKDDRIFGIV
jgi:tRNA(Ile)-lysidine synthetase-like protein